MYEGKNPTALKSMKWLSNAMIELLKEREYEDIHVKDICKKADLSRPTFYQFFDSKKTLVCYCIRQEFFSVTTIPEELTLNELMKRFARYFAEHKEVLRLFHQRGLDYLAEMELSEVLNQFGDYFSPDMPAKAKAIATAFYTKAFVGSLTTWALNDDITEEEMVTYLHNLVHGKFFLFDKF